MNLNINHRVARKLPYTPDANELAVLAKAGRPAHDSDKQLREYAQRNGMLNLRDDGMRWVMSGDTSLEEVIRVTRE